MDSDLFHVYFGTSDDRGVATLAYGITTIIASTCVGKNVVEEDRSPTPIASRYRYSAGKDIGTAREYVSTISYFIFSASTISIFDVRRTYTYIYDENKNSYPRPRLLINQKGDTTVSICPVVPACGGIRKTWKQMEGREPGGRGDGRRKRARKRREENGRALSAD